MEKLLKKLSFVLLLILITAGGIFVLTRKPNTIEGVETFPDQGRNHIPAGTVVEYNSHPPTSGPHYADWEKPGYYDRVLPDGRLIHSLEHGYIVVSYNCEAKSKIKDQKSKIQIKDQKLLFGQVFAHETNEPHEETEATSSSAADVSGWKTDPECQKLVGELKSVMEKSKAKRLILVPRPSLDTKIALTAWGRMDKMDEIDQAGIFRFIRAYHNKGPERTME